MLVTVVDHPLAARLLTRLRDETTDQVGFRQAIADLSMLLVYEATRDLAVDEVEVRTPLGPTAGTRLARPPLVVPVLRAGLGLMPGIEQLLPEAETAFIGVARNEETFHPVPYMNTVPEHLDGRPVLVLDPMLATGGSLEHTCRILAAHGAGPITCATVLGTPYGITRLDCTRLVARIVTAAIDMELNDQKYIVPGLGDAGDRLFGVA